MNKTKKPFYEEHLPRHKVDEYVRQGLVFVGQLHLSQRDTMMAYCKDPSLSTDVLIFGKKARNRALDGDTVAVQLIVGDERDAIKGHWLRVKTEKKLTQLKKDKHYAFDQPTNEIELLIADLVDGRDDSVILSTQIFGF